MIDSGGGAAGDLLRAVGFDPAAVVRAITVDELPIVGARVDLSHAAEAWQGLRAHHDESGWWPFLSREGPELWAAESTHWSVGRGRDRLATALRVPPDEVVEDLITAHRAGGLDLSPHGEDLVRYRLDLFDVDRTRLLAASNPPERPRALHSEFGGAMWDPEWVCLVPAAAGYELPALLYAPYANDWQASADHDRLTQEDHVGVLRSWQSRFGARLRYLSRVGVGLVVDRPPTDPEEIARVAVEQFAYCDDLVQFIGETHRVAQLQVPTSHWYFWWD
jgi:hypothetical protein